jgi:hypothetical protein
LLYAVMRDGIYELYTYSSNDKRSAPFGVRSIYPPGSAVSPDGQWVAYFQRDHGGLPGSLFVQPLSGGAKNEVRNGSGIHPLWVPGGSPLRLIHRLPGSVYLLELTTSPTFGIAKTLELPWGVLFNPGPSSSRNMDFAGNDRIVTVTVPQMDQPASRGDEEMIQVVLNWLDELKQRVPMLR